jgi:hypothetical protein
MEKNFEDNIAVLNAKIKELNDYIDELESKNNQRFRDSTHSEVLKNSFC